MEFLEGFERKNGRLVGRVATPAGYEYIQDLEQLRTRGLPLSRNEWRSNGIVFDVNSLEQANTSSYIEGLGVNASAGSCMHDIFVCKTQKLRLLIPTLAVIRGLFPLVPTVFGTLLSPRGLAEVCTPLEKDGQWTVQTARRYKNRSRQVSYPMYEALTWAWLFRSGDEAWHSVYKNAAQGQIRIALPAVRINALMEGIKQGSTVFVTSMKAAALLAYDAPYPFADGAPHSFLFHHHARSLYGPANNYHAVRDTPHPVSPEISLTDIEWSKVSTIFSEKPGREHAQTIPRRELADALLKRMATNAPWTSAVYAPLWPLAVGRQWRRHLKSGSFRSLGKQ
ncbi:MAG TPA: hypothetical protein VNS29_11310 [Burkholderiaceae bacterium]|nr:hypothetical protein [Burkholderiaceae bacterium]